MIFDADGTLVDAFRAVEAAFAHHGMDIGDYQRFQRRRKLLKYLGGLREFPHNLRRQLNKENRKRFKHSLTEIYRGEAKLFPGMANLLRRLIATPDIRVGIVSRNVTIEPETTLSLVLQRHDIDVGQLDFLRCIPLGEGKAGHFRSLRQGFGINPARAFACGDEYQDYAAALNAGLHPLIVSYGFEDHTRLTDDFDVLEDIISRTPAELIERLLHALDLSPNIAHTTLADIALRANH
ncbi:HAD family hydrolase [Dechloromonas sp. ARDL1]|uniref:HAD family hydrolase n=1 Tax=Dechloromonas sp. ARDL1 TaxID=3322121 RepID=UPI003DA796C7